MIPRYESISGDNSPIFAYDLYVLDITRELSTDDDVVIYIYYIPLETAGCDYGTQVPLPTYNPKCPTYKPTLDYNKLINSAYRDRIIMDVIIDQKKTSKDNTHNVLNINEFYGKYFLKIVQYYYYFPSVRPSAAATVCVETYFLIH